MGTSSGANFHQQQSPKMLPPRQRPRSSGLQTSLSLASSDANGSHDIQEPLSNSDQANDSPSDSTSSRETWPIETGRSNCLIIKSADKEEGESNFPEPQVLRRISTVDKLSLREVARERLDIVSDRMAAAPIELLEELKAELRVILEGTGGAQHREEFLRLQQLVQARDDLTSKTLVRAHRVQLEILVSINTGILAFLHPNVSLAHSRLIEIFLYKRCRNIACQSALPADDCSCEVCTRRNGFCNLCMCVVCNKFDFEVNTCRWIGCDICAHWTHTDCAMRAGQIGMGPSAKSIMGHSEMLFRCPACNKTSELLGWVKDVFQHCAPGWDQEGLLRELEFVCRIFRLCEDVKGRKLYWKCCDLIEKLKTGALESTSCRMLLLVFQELEIESTKNTENEDLGCVISPQEACNRIADVVQEAVRKMEMVAEEKLQMLKRARLAVESCDRELEDKAREVTELKMERQRKKQQVEELESIVRLKELEADMFQDKANQARQEAERLQSIALAKTEKAEQDYVNMYLKRRLVEAEAEKQYLFEKMKLQESQRTIHGSGVGCSGIGGSGDAGAGAGVGAGVGNDPSQTLMFNKIQDLLKNVYNVTPKTEGQQPK
ncbi:OBERON-like protein [Phalaenopsis equestris]|uniref:OBERON-like protein n=1 Tax=Phalaenopsis equestris TaxID=78828 RepID=UPI0009E39AFC|nr:OBERON-like protein [Phalaenopsis equestris]